MKRFGIAGIIVVAMLGTPMTCGGPGAPTKPGEAEKVTVRIGSGTTLGKSNFGMWKAGDDVPESCRWTVKVNGKVAASGGAHDAVISGHGVQGGILSATHCGYFYK